MSRKNMYVVEMVQNIEPHDDDRFDYEGELTRIWEDTVFNSLEAAWNELKSRFIKDEYGNDRFKGDYLDYNGDVYDNLTINDGYEVDEEKHTIHIRTGCECYVDFRIKELKRKQLTKVRGYDSRA